MGDCHLRILQSVNCSNLTELSSSLWSSDSTIFDCFQAVKINVQGGNKRSLWELLEEQVVSVWDCTKHPTKNITQICLTSGKLTTLHAAGWFPSGTLQVLNADAISHIGASVDAHQDIQFNQESESLKAVEDVRLVGNTFDAVKPISGSRPTASQVLRAVPERFKDEGDRDMADAILLRRQNRQNRREVEEERDRKLDARIQRLSSLPASRTSLQVRKMLIKSRATGRNSLQEEDRVYLHVCFVDDEKREEYRFFSKQDTIGNALATFLDESKSPDRELLVSSDRTFYRLPSSLRFQEAIQRKVLEPEIATIYVRFFSRAYSNCTTSIEERSTQVISATDEISNKPESCEFDKEALTTMDYVDPAESIPPIPGMEQLRGMIALLFPLPKKQTPTHIKVQQMKMKSKAIGDAKRIKLSDRFFFELVVVNRQDNDWKLSPKGPVYYAFSDPVDRCWLEIRPQASSSDWTVMVFEENELRLIASSIPNSRSQSWETLCVDGKLSQFSTVIWVFQEGLPVV